DLNIEIESQKGEKIREVTTSFSKITDLDWETVKNLGKEDIVPLPWHPVAISGNKVGVLGRDYYLGGLCLPEKIDVAGKNILASPVTLECIVNGNKVNLLKSPSKIISQRKSEVVFKNIEELSGLRIESQALIEFDGMMKIDLDLVPLGKTAKIERLKLIIPIKKDMANLLQYASSWDSARQSKQPSWKELWNCIELPDTLGEVWKSWFRFHLWVGGGKDSDTGISWFAESDENWVNKDNNNVQSIVNNKDSAIVEIVFIDSPVEIAKSIRFTFGLQATPVRPSINSRIYRAGSNVYEGGNLNASFDDFYGNGYSAFNPSGSTGLIALSNATGVFVAPYTVANYFPLVSMPGPYDFYKGCALSMGSPPFIESWKAIGHQLEYGLVPNLRSCIKSRFKDYFVWKMKYLFENYNPPLVYIDNMGVPQCNNILHGCGYEKGGRRYCTFPIFDLRDFLKRSRVVLTILGKKPPYFYVHSGYSLPPVHSFADIGLTGEQYNEILGERLTKGESLDYHDIMDWTMMKYEFRGGPCGLARIFLPEFTGSPPAPAKYFEENPGLLRDKTEGLVSIALLHDGNLWNAYCDNTVINRVWKALSDFGYFDAKFSPYWENNIFKPGNKETRVSYYRKDNTMLLVVSNPTESDINEIIEIDFANLGFKIKEAEDIYRSERFSLDGNRIPMTLAKRNFRLILIRGQ
ncbi:MAG: hypothetical protein HY606_12760, partial [Planctomycetes bacterium]|nr:hypothetical protein [Planctomycetota bacterium]